MRMEKGLCVVHLFADRGPAFDRDAALAAIDEASRDECQVITAAILGHKCEIAVMALGADVDALHRLEAALRRAGLTIADSYVSITEVSEYAEGLPAEMLRDRLYPQLPPADKPAFCFYPMSKRREGHANWYTTPFEERREMMYEHGASGRKFAGQLVQLITSSTGLDDFEWGVTLFADGLEVVKAVVYTLRFDLGSAVFGEFGRFYVGIVGDAADVF